jgi:FixJ family two-component response regulator
MKMEQSIFVVDDEAATRESVAGMAASMGVNAEAYQSAEDFLARRGRSASGCLVLDIWLRGMSGLEFLDVMRRDGICLPTIVVTAIADVALAVRIMHSGAFTVLEKPFRVQELWDTIRQALALDARTRHNGARAVDVRSQLGLLTVDERRVLELILTGRTNKEISKQVSLPLRTVEARRQTLMVKLKADSLAELVQAVTEARLLFSVPFARAGLFATERQSALADPVPCETEPVG